MRGCARFLVWLEPWLRRLVSEAARWARVGTRTVPNGQLRIDRARRGSNGHPSAAMLPDRECPVGDETRESPLRTTLKVTGIGPPVQHARRGTGHSRRRTKLEARRARYMYGGYRMSRVDEHTNTNRPHAHGAVGEGCNTRAWGDATQFIGVAATSSARKQQPSAADDKGPWRD
jgi:hypothetical protein